MSSFGVAGYGAFELQQVLAAEKAAAAEGMCAHDALAALSEEEAARYRAAEAAEEAARKAEWDRLGEIPADEYYAELFTDRWARAEPAGTAQLVSGRCISFSMSIEGFPLRHHSTMAKLQDGSDALALLVVAPSLVNNLKAGQKVKVSRIENIGADSWVYILDPPAGTAETQE
jgi:hypothetical protein